MKQFQMNLTKRIEQLLRAGLAEGKKLARSAPYIIQLLATSAVADVALHRPSGMLFPETIAGFERTHIEDYESKAPGAGFQYTYRSSGRGVASVYVYTAQIKDMPSDVYHPIFSKIRDEAVQGIRRQSRGAEMEATQIDESIVKISTGDQVVHIMSNSFIVKQRDKETYKTKLWIWAARNHLFKIRLSHTAAAGLDDNNILDFLEGVVRLSVDKR
jgi:hypothetical protein